MEEYNYRKELDTKNIYTDIIFTDGSCTQNGKSDARAGIGIFFGTKDVRNRSQELHSKHPLTNQIAELSAILLTLMSFDLRKPIRVLIITDSQYSINCITRWSKKWIKTNWTTTKGPVKNRELIEKILDYISHIESIKENKIEFKWIKSHSNNFGNEQADKLSRQCLI